MILNTVAINSVAINAASNNTVNIIIDEVVNIFDIVLPLYKAPLSDVISFSEEINLKIILNLVEGFKVDTDYTSKAIGASSIEETIKALSFLKVLFSDTVSDTLTFSDSLTLERTSIVKLFEKVHLLDTSLNKASLKEILSLFIKISTENTSGLLKEISESFSLTETLTTTIAFIEVLDSVISFSETLSENTSLIGLLSDEVSLQDESNTSALFKTLLSEEIILSITDGLGYDTFSTYLLSPETFSVSTYTNYNFIGSCKYNNQYFFINNKGLYKYGGLLDETDFIEAIIQTSALSFGTSSLKQVPYFYMGLSNSNKIVLKVAVDGKATSHYILNRKTQGLQTQKINIGKGLIGRYFQFELITSDNTELSLESLEFLPLKLKRKF